MRLRHSPWRRVATVLALLACSVWGLAPVTAKPPRTKTAKLKSLLLEPSRPFHYALPKGRSPASEQRALAGKVAKRKLMLVDIDGDGRYDEPGVDGWTLDDERYLVPFVEPLVFGDRYVRVRVADDRKRLEYTVTGIDAPREHREELVALNDLRLRNGLLPAGYDAELSEGCRLHCLYCDVNGIGHHEQPGKPRYTEAGARCGIKCNISQNPGMHFAGRDMYRSFFHRRTLMHPWNTAFGFGRGERHVAVDGGNARVRRPWTYPVIIPAPDTGGHPTDFDHTEQPPPVPRQPTAGLPITLQWPVPTRIQDVEASLKTAKGKALEIHVSWPEKPAHASVPHNQYAICIIPALELAPRATYHVEVKAKINGKPYERSFQFETGR